ncbi:MAG: molybdopterin molybdotransferase MoeA [Candidatus Rokubacteria bacterium]|nr:molybdopterin molybdotransferase MoeA [Candidatus Rokubacteria bacterium]MBI3825456.1 molybdopterin molybdotransferase MoeA [Candidatus Rokubacteria bacterium]
MLNVEEALQKILERVGPLETERVDLLASLGRALAEPIVSGREIPPWPNSSMDGYALRAADVRAGETRMPVVGRITAGVMPSRTLGAGETMRIFTGAPLPEGADAVVPQEDVRVDDGHVVLRGPIPAGAFVRPRGEDVRPGDRVLDAGAALGPAEIGLLAALGHGRPLVHRRPRVAILSTGDELAELGSEPGPGQIPNSNSYSLFAQALEAGAEPVILGIAADRLETIEERLTWGLGADVLLSSAGVSVGEADLVKDALTRLGAELHLWQVSMRPGKPITFGTLGRTLVFGLPGNPVSAMVTFELFVRPALRRLAGHAALMRPRLRARALARIANPGARRGYLRATLVDDGSGYGVRLTGDQGSGILRSMVLADGLAIVPPDTTLEAGQEVDVIVLRSPVKEPTP